MMEIWYLSRADRERLRILTETLPTSALADKDGIHIEIREIMAKRKPLNQCNLDECMALKADMYDHYKKSLAIAKPHLTDNFKNAIMMIEARMVMNRQEFERERAERLLRQNQKIKRRVRDNTSSEDDTNEWVITKNEVDYVERKK